MSRGVLPFSYVKSLMFTLGSIPGIRFATMADLTFPQAIAEQTEDSMADYFLAENREWQRQSGQVDGWDIFFLHDCDSGPAETERLCRFEARFGFRSTTSLFARWVQQGSVEAYPVNFDLLARLERTGGLCFTYHCNAYEVSGYDPAAMPGVFDADVAFLRGKGLSIGHFAPHGGVPGPDGRNNNSFFYPDLVRTPLHWTHNRFAPRGFRYSDGGLVRVLETGQPRLDLLDFLLTSMRRARRGRAFILLHPQYYFATDDREAAPFFDRNPWLARFWDLHARGRAGAYWKPLREAFGVTDAAHFRDRLRRRATAAWEGLAR